MSGGVGGGRLGRPPIPIAFQEVLMSERNWKRPTSITLGQRDKQALESLAKFANCSRSELVRKWIRAQVAQQQQGDKP